jgi:hypothetical protein
VILVQQSAVPDQSDQTTGRECTSAEAEQEHLVPRLIVVQQEAVSVLDVLVQAFAECSAEEAIHPLLGADSPVVKTTCTVPCGAEGSTALAIVTTFVGVSVSVVFQVPSKQTTIRLDIDSSLRATR